MIALMTGALAINPAMNQNEATAAPEETGERVESVRPAASGADAVYEGALRVFMSEPDSRFTDLNGDHYSFGFLRFADSVGLYINSGEVYTRNVQWDVSDADLNGVEPDNLVAQAVCFNSTWAVNYSDPPSGAPFILYPADAAAQAAPGLPGQDLKSVDYTHTVFIEECTKKY